MKKVKALKAVGASYKASRSELAAIRKGEQEIARGEFITLTDLLHDLDRNRRQVRAKRTRKVAR